MAKIRVTALYKFVPFEAPEALRTPLFERLRALGIKGTILLASEGINGTIAGAPQAMEEALDAIRGLPGCAEIDWKDSYSDAMPFLRLKVRLKSEIVTMGVPGTDPTCLVGSYVQPEDWNALISDPDTVVIDTRNDYEVALGTFQGAIDPQTESFRAFPDWFERFRADLAAQNRTPKIAMFCTGGIRCEKSTSYVKSLGIDEVYHLHGGILKYLETVPAEDSLWQGECFVFDDRVSVGHGLKPGPYQLCHACRYPISPEDRASPLFEQGVSCPHCHGTFTPEKIAALRERQKQVRLAEARGENHIGDEVVMAPRKKPSLQAAE
ncbi:MAG: rhodanese-related sulfurtransferase [Pseudomonadota bacterium]